MSDTEVLEQPKAEANAGVAIPGEAAPTPQAQEGGHDDIESRARSMGWRPKEEFRGPEEKWVDPAEFVRRGENELPVLRERLRDQTRKLAQIEAESHAKLDRVAKMAEVAVQRQRQELISQYESLMRHAAESADVGRYDQLRRDQAQAVRQFDEHIAETTQQSGPPQMSPQIQAQVTAWVQENPWFDRDPMLQAVARQHSVELDRSMPGLSLQENLERTRSYVAEKFPEKFGRQPRASGGGAQPGMVEGGSRVSASSGPRSKGASDLPADVRKAGERFVSQGLYKNLSEYARDYYEQG